MSQIDPTELPATIRERLKPTVCEAMAAVRTLLRYIGEDPEREGLRGTPARVVRSYAELFAGYDQDPAALLATTFEEGLESYDEMVVLTGMRLESYCEHHMVPIIGECTVGYIPDGGRVVGISKLGRVVDAFAKRLQIQERLTEQIAYAVQDALHPKGVGVVIRAEHQCMTTRGVHKVGTLTVTSKLLGAFKDDPAVKAEFQRHDSSR